MVSYPPLVVAVADLELSGARIEGAATFADLDIPEDDRVRLPYPLHYALHVAPVQAGILATGRLDAVVRVQCDRCLEPVDVPLSVPDVCHHFEEVTALVVDLTEHVREDILLVFPHGCLCREECRGLCPECGGNLNDTACDCRRVDDEATPWDALDGLDLSPAEPDENRP